MKHLFLSPFKCKPCSISELLICLYFCVKKPQSNWTWKSQYIDEGQRIGFDYLKCPFPLLESMNGPISIFLFFIIKDFTWLLGTMDHVDQTTKESPASYLHNREKTQRVCRLEANCWDMCWCCEPMLLPQCYHYFCSCAKEASHKVVSLLNWPVFN